MFCVVFSGVPKKNSIPVGIVDEICSQKSALANEIPTRDRRY